MSKKPNTTSNYNNEIMKNVKHILKEQQLCDVVLIAGSDGKRIPAHRLILSAASDYFKTMFTGSLRESTEHEITLIEINGKTLQAIVTYCYSGDLKLREDNADLILSSAHMLQFNSVVDQCSQFLNNHLSTSNCLGIESIAEKFDRIELWENAQRFISINFEQVVKSEEFYNLNANQLGDLLSKDNLNVNLEETVFDCLMSWVQRDEPNRKNHLPQLLPHIRLNFLDHQFMKDNVESVYRDNGLIQLVLDAYENKLINPEHTKRRYKGNGYLLGFDRSGNFWSFCPDLKKWTLIEEMKLNRKCCGFAIWEDKLIAVGGNLINSNRVVKTVQYWDVENKIWMDISPLIQGRFAMGVAVLGGSLYAVGGYKEASVECLDALSGSWRSVASLPIASSNIRVVAYNESIYAEDLFNSNCYCYDLGRNIWNYLGKTDAYLKSYLVANGDLYAFRGDALHRFNMHINTWTTYSKNCLHVRASCILDDRIFTVHEQGNICHVKTYDLNKKVFTDLAEFNKNFTNIFAIKNL